MIAARNQQVAFVVMMAGSGVPGDQILAAQSLLLSQASGQSSIQAEANARRERDLLAIVKQTTDDAALEKKLSGLLPQAQLQAQLKQIASPWFRYFIAYDPAEAL